MTTTITRGFVGLTGLLLLGIAILMCVHAEQAATGLGLQTVSLIGRSTMRAAIAAQMGGIGFMQIIAAIRTSRIWLLGALIMTAAILVGRVLGVALDGLDPNVTRALVIEIIMVGVLYLSYRTWSKTA